MLWKHEGAVSLSPKPEPCFEQVVLSYEAALLKRALGLTGGCRSDAEDLVQETLMRAWKQFCASPQEAPCRAWLIKTLTNLFIDECRRRKRRPGVTPITPEFEVAAPATEPLPAWREVTAEQLEAAIASLEEEFRSVYVLRARRKLSYDEIAALLDIPRSTVGTRLHRARSKLRDVLGAKEEA
jgi:RNA polymerase sigma-70 factor, ECF subfamily